MTHVAYLTACVVCFAVGWWLWKQLDETDELRRDLGQANLGWSNCHDCCERLRDELHAVKAERDDAVSLATNLRTESLAALARLGAVIETSENQECDSNS